MQNKILWAKETKLLLKTKPNRGLNKLQTDLTSPKDDLTSKKKENLYDSKSRNYIVAVCRVAVCRGLTKENAPKHLPH